MGKYRGDDEDWLDEEGDKKNPNRAASRVKPKPKVTFLSKESANAKVIEVYPQRARVRMLLDGAVRDVGYRKSKIPTAEIQERAPVAVGDFVQVGGVEGSYQVEGVCVRENAFSRPAPHTQKRHVLAANIDTIAIVSSTRSPDFSPGLLDRFLVSAHASHIEPTLIVNKSDLIADQTSGEWQEYIRLGYKVYLVCSKDPDSLLDLKSWLLNKTAVFCGTSGVGKTSLLRGLLGDPSIGRIAEISENTGRGVHTTTSSMFIHGTDWVDTPGIRELGLWQIARSDLREYFPEFRDLSCQSTGCLHLELLDECDAKSLFRWPSYIRIFNSLDA